MQILCNNALTKWLMMWRKTLTSELRHCKFAIKLDESTFEVHILSCLSFFHNSFQNDTFNEFLLANYPETGSIETIVSCLQ